MATALKYAEMSELRDAVSSRRQIRFECSGLHYLAEPHEIATCPRTRSFVVVLWVLNGPGGTGWKTVRFCHMREMEVAEDRFHPRGDLPSRW